MKTRCKGISFVGGIEIYTIHRQSPESSFEKPIGIQAIRQIKTEHYRTQTIISKSRSLGLVW